MVFESRGKLTAPRLQAEQKLYVSLVSHRLHAQFSSACKFLGASPYHRVETRMEIDKIFPQQYNIHSMEQMEMIKDHLDEQKRERSNCSWFPWVISSCTISQWAGIDPTWDGSHPQAGAAHPG